MTTLSTKTRVIIDTDPGIDDAIALGFALAAKALDIKLITTVSGNVGIENVTNNALKLLKFWNQHVPVARGAAEPLLRKPMDASDVHGASGMRGYEFDGIQPDCLLEETELEEQQRVIMEGASVGEKTTLVTLGPLTNIALLLKAYPQVKEHIERIVMMGGALTRGNLGVMSEFNVGVDPEAAKIVFASGVHVAMVGLEVGDAARVMPEDIENIQNSGKSGDMLVKLLLNYRVHYQEEGFSMYDPTAVAYLLAPQMFETKDVFVDVECAGALTAGCTVVDLAGYLGEKPNATVCVGVDQKAFRTWFVHQIQKCNVLDGSASAVEGVLLD